MQSFSNIIHVHSNKILQKISRTHSAALTNNKSRKTNMTVKINTCLILSDSFNTYFTHP